jgi:DNA polymerase-1
MSSLFLFDVSAYLHRAMHVVYGDRVATVDPNDSQFIKHACAMIANTMQRCDVSRMVLVQDSLEPSFRCDVYPAYKAGRRDHYPVFKQGAPRFFAAMEKAGVKVLGVPRFEADDLIASLVQVLRQRRGAKIVIVSSDKDLLMHVEEAVLYFICKQEGGCVLRPAQEALVHYPI